MKCKHFLFRVPIMLFFMVGTGTVSFGQLNGNDPKENFDPKILPPAPEAALLQRFVEVPVNYYTGVPDISVPLLEVQDGSLSLPLSLSYHAGGNKVEDIAPYTGLAWSLTGPGMISRVVRGKPDDEVGFLKFIQEGITYQSLTTDMAANLTTLHQLSDGCKDAEPDQFFFNINGYTGKFGFNWQGKLEISSNAKVQITPTFQDSDNTKRILGWTLVTGDGTTYKFFDIDEATTKNYSLSCNISGSFASSWYVTEMYDVNNQNRMYFQYTGYPYDLSFETSEIIIHNTTKHGDCGTFSPQPITSSQSIRYAGKRIARISTLRGYKVEFLAQTAREDLTGINQPVLNSLDEIIYKDEKGQILKHYKLGYDYSTGRLSLKGVTEIGVDGKEQLQRYRFSYSSVKLPERTSKAQDHWGYYNNNTENSLVPATKLEIDGQLRDFTGAKRSPDPYKMSAGILTKIEYPGQGFTSIEFEPHKYIFTQYGRITEYETVKTGPSLSHCGECKQGSCDITKAPDGWVELPFEINEVVTAEVRMSNSVYNEPYLGMNRDPQAQIYKEDGTLLLQISGINRNEIFLHTFKKGKYKLKVRAFWQGDCAEVSVLYDQPSNVPIKQKTAGGLRIRKITDFSEPGSPAITREFSYTMEDDYSSGVIYEQPNYVYSYTRYVSTNFGSETPCKFYYRVARNVKVLGSTQGSHIGYQRVKVSYSEGDKQGYTLYKYSTPLDHPDDVGSYPPFPPPTSYSYKTGLLKAVETYQYEQETESFTKVKEEQFSYGYKQYEIPALKVGFRGGSYSSNAILKYDMGTYKLVLGHSQLQEKKEVWYQDNTPTLEKVSQSTFDAQLQNMVKQMVRTSEGSELTTNYYFPQDYALLPDTHPIRQMNSKGMQAIPIETITRKKDAGGINGKFYEYQTTGGTVQLKKIYVLETARPLATFQPSVEKIEASLTASYPQQPAITHEQYDVYGNLLGATSMAGQTSGYIWGYGKTLPIAEVKQATYQHIAYTSFESDDQGNWLYATPTTYSQEARTGTRSTVADLSKNGLTKGDYIVSLWAKGSGSVKVNGIAKTINSQWGYYEWQLPATESVSIQAQGNLLDEVRLYPKGALMTTFTYDPGTGVTSQTGPDNQTIYYRYDNLRRLHAILDHQGNILKRLTYHYIKPYGL